MRAKIISVLIPGLISINSFSQLITWKHKANLPNATMAGTAVTCQGNIYFIGGQKDTGPGSWGGSNMAFKYVSEKNEWREIPNMPTARWNFAAATSDGKIYVIGGDNFLDNNEMFNPDLNTWTTLNSLPTPRQHVKAVVVNEKIYVIGGLESWSKVSVKNEMYDPQTDTWHEKAPIPTSKHNYAAIEFNNKIYVFGGSTQVGNNIWVITSSVEVYDTELNSWSTQLLMPVPRFNPGIFVYKNKIALAGGFVGDYTSARIDFFEPGTGKWSNGNSLPYKNVALGLTCLDNKIYILGGSGGPRLDYNGKWDQYNAVYEGNVIDSIDYFGLLPPENSSLSFKPEILEIQDIHSLNAIFRMHEQNEFYYTRIESKENIYYSRKHDAIWTNSKMASFSTSEFDDADPFFSGDGNRVYFVSSRPAHASDSKYDWNIWYADWNDSTWWAPKPLPEPINSDYNEYFFSISNFGNAFFASNRPGGHGSFDIYQTSFISTDSLSNPVNIGKPINSMYREFDPFISPNEDFIVLSIKDKPGGMGKSDIYISFKKDNGRWTNPKNLGNKINTLEHDYAPSISPENKYFFYTSDERMQWISTELFDLLKESNFIPYVLNPIPDTSFAANDTFNIVIGEQAFIDDDENETLLLTARLDSGNDWPDSLKFNPATGTLSGRISKTGGYDIRITATDSEGESTSDIFKLTIKGNTSVR